MPGINKEPLRLLLVTFASVTALSAAATANAQQHSPGYNVEDIIVTARKRDESLLSVPVVVSAVGAAEIDRRAINGLDAVARIVPGLIIGEGGGTAQGGNVVIRGISGADTNTFAEQAVSFNVDGVQIARATVRRLGQFDAQQVEVLKGPQTLFFGKNSPGGVISIRSADPTDRLEAKLQGGYEFNAHEFRGEGFISGPIADGLGVRLAAYGSHLRGWIKNEVPDSSPFQPDHEWGPQSREYAGRLTLKYDKGGDFNARLKLSYSRMKGDAATWNFQLIDCPLGAPQPLSFATPDNCTRDDKTYVGDDNGAFVSVDPRLKSGKSFMKLNQFLGSLEMNYSPSDEITVTSVTGLYNSEWSSSGNFTQSYNPATLFTSYFDPLKFREWSEEIRVRSDFDSPVNFMFGGFAQDSSSVVDQLGLLNTNAPIAALRYHYEQEGRAYSAFGQLLWKVVPTFELSLGGRYSYERKTMKLAQIGPGTSAVLVTVLPAQPKLTFNDFSPELTATWRPSDNLTVFGSYRRGFLSGGFNAGGEQFDNIYRPQTTKGFEAGVKARLLDGALRTNLSVYNYKVDDLQTTVTVQGVISELRNAAEARVKGIEFDVNYRTPIEGLSLTGALAYTHARYLDYIASCYRGQPTPDCRDRISPITGQLALSQDLAGRQMLRAPDWSGNAGFLFERPVGSSFKLGLSGDMSFTSGYFTDPTLKPKSRENSFQLFNAAVRIADAEDRWEVALIGNNLTDKYYFVRSSDRPFTGTSPGGSPDTSILADTIAPLRRGREVFLRFTVRYGQ